MDDNKQLNFTFQIDDWLLPEVGWLIGRFWGAGTAFFSARFIRIRFFLTTPLYAARNWRTSRRCLRSEERGIRAHLSRGSALSNPETDKVRCLNYKY